MVKYLFIYSFLLVGFSVNAQLKFYEKYNSGGSDVGEGIVELPDTSYIICGTSTSFFDGAPQAFLMKIDSVGKHLWAKQYGGLETETAKRIFHTPNDGFYVFGETNTTPTGDFDIYVFHTNDAGDLIWEKKYGTTSWDILHDAVKFSDSSYILVGETYGTLDGETDGFLMRLDKNGDTLYTLQTGFSGVDRFRGVVNYYDTAFAVGGMVWNADSNFYKSYVALYSLDGNLIWDQQYGDTGNYEVLDIEKNNGELLCVGYRVNPSDSLADDYGLRLSALGSVIFTFSIPFPGARAYEKITSYGNQNRFFLGLTNDDQYTTGPGKDAFIDDFSGGLFSFNNGVDIDGNYDDEIGQILATKDNGAIVVGSNRNLVPDIPNVFVMKIGPGQDYPNTLSPVTAQSLVALKENNIQDIFHSLYPNPTSHYFKIKNELMVEGNWVYIFNLEGEIVLKTFYSVKDAKIDVSELSKGLYFVKSESQSGQFSVLGKIIVQ